MNNIKIITAFFALILFAGLLIFNTSHTSDASEFAGSKFEPSNRFSTPWVDSVLNSLTLEQKIAQLFMIEVRTDQNLDYYNRIGRLLQEYNVGGVIFFRGGPMRQAKLTNKWQSQMQTPMLVAMDAEWGLAMRLDSTPAFPRQMTLGAITNERLIYELGLEMGWQCRRMGVHINFSPVVDVNSNPLNPVINFRSFGECRYNVARKGIALMAGMNDAGIIATAKHFPGHGDTDTDSHYTLPLLKHPIDKIDSIHIFPFRHLIDQGLTSIMVAHLSIPEITEKKNVATSLSKTVVTDLLQHELGFRGLIITDALNMKGVTDHFQPGELELKALMAGNDILIMPQNLSLAIKTIKEAVANNLITEEFINYKCRKVLYFKQEAGLDKLKPIQLGNLISDLNSPRIENINRRLAEASITLVRNNNNLIPLQRLDTLKIAALTIGSAVDNPFQSMLANYAPLDMYSLTKNHTASQAETMHNTLSGYNLVIVSVQNNSMFPGQNYGISDQTISFVNELSKSNNVILNVFANPYSIQSFGRGILNARSIIVSYQDGKTFEEASAQIIFGALPARGRLPVTAAPWFPLYTGIITQGQQRIRYGSADDAAISRILFNQIDSIINDAIRQKAFPGCQVAIIKNGVMIYNRAFGYHTYDSLNPVRNSDIYDIASLTKILATTAALMKLSDKGKLDIDENIGKYLPEIEPSRMANLNIRDILAHQARLRSWIPLHLRTIKDGRPNPQIFATSRSDEFPYRVASELYLRKDYRDTIFSQIIQAELLNRRRYLYSDLGFVLLAEVVKNLTGKTIDQYVTEEFFKPMGLSTIGFNPLQRHPLQRIIPTERDTVFRNQLIHGHVHDPTAALLGGVAGHSGLFSNARDVAIMMQMFLQGGSYGGIQFIHPETISEFTRTQFAGNKNRRGLGFDKPAITGGENRQVYPGISQQSFGHTGFTGTIAWADPREELIFVFLANRIYPDISNNKITELDVRLKIQQAIYNAINVMRFLLNVRLP